MKSVIWVAGLTLGWLMDQVYLEPFNLAVSIVTSTILTGESTRNLEITAPFSLGWPLHLSLSPMCPCVLKVSCEMYGLSGYLKSLPAQEGRISTEGSAGQWQIGMECQWAHQDGSIKFKSVAPVLFYWAAGGWEQELKGVSVMGIRAVWREVKLRDSRVEEAERCEAGRTGMLPVRAQCEGPCALDQATDVTPQHN